MPSNVVDFATEKATREAQPVGEVTVRWSRTPEGETLTEIAGTFQAGTSPDEIATELQRAADVIRTPA
jgi:hypothetical protein